MKKLFSFLVMALLMFSVTLSVLPPVLADGDDAEGDVDIEIEGAAPEVFTDVTERCWNPNDQTFLTAEVYGDDFTNFYEDDCFDVPLRGNYLFSGETMAWYVMIWDENGESDIDDVLVMRDDGAGPVGVGACGELDPADFYIFDGDELPQFNLDGSFGEPDSFEDATMNLYKCLLIVPALPVTGDQDFFIRATDDDGNIGDSTWTDTLAVNPPLSVSLTGAISFGSAEAGETATSNSVTLDNVGSDGVVMDMYIASDDFFTDPSNPLAICGDGNGIPFDAFSYFATKGSSNSGSNNANYEGLGAGDGTGDFTPGETCNANEDEYTPMTSHSGETNDMCRIINHLEDGSLLVQGQSMSLTFQVDVPTPCTGSFTSGQFHFRGRAV